jgi:hypothetical protein
MMAYQNETGDYVIVDTVQTKLEFIDEQQVDGSLSQDRIGRQIVHNDTVNFVFVFGFSSGICDFYFNQADIGKIPIGGIGKVQVYKFSMPEKNEMELFIEYEFDVKSGKVLRNTSYHFKKV